MKVSTAALVAAILCWIVGFVITPVLMLAQMPNLGLTGPTLAGLACLLVWARCMARGR